MNTPTIISKNVMPYELDIDNLVGHNEHYSRTRRLQNVDEDDEWPDCVWP